MTTFTLDEARDIAGQIGLDLATAPFDPEQFRMGLEVEIEHGSRDPRTNVTGNDPLLTGKIAWAHLTELPDYYTRLHDMEKAAEGVRSEPTLADLRHELARMADRLTELTKLVSEGQFESWKARIEDLELKASLAKMELRDEAAPYLEELEGRLASAREDFSFAGERASEAWDAMVAGLRKAFSEMRQTFEKARERIS